MRGGREEEAAPMRARSERTFRLVVAYDGTDFAGMQSQRNARTVQDVLEDALETVLKERQRIVAASRTDAGVHALGQVVRIRTVNAIPDDRVVPALNRVLPPDVVVRYARRCRPEFHPRYDARSRTYRYRIDNRPVPDVLSRRYAWHVRQRLDVEAMQAAAAMLLGSHDFAAFCSAGSPSSTTVRMVTRFDCRRRGGDVFVAISANAFLYRMVRNLVGALVDIGRGLRPVSALREICDSGSRRECSAPAPPQGLTLIRVQYPVHDGRLSRRQPG